MADDVLYYIGFSHFLGIGPVRFSLLKKNFGSAKAAYLAKKIDLELILGSKLTEKFVEFREKFDLEKKFKEIKRKNIQVLTVDDEDYPKDLKNISDPPICLYIKSYKAWRHVFSSTSSPTSLGGPPSHRLQKQAPSLELTFAIVGTRQPTQYGIDVARKFSYELAKAGFVIVSGLAYGIDTIAHQACLEAEGKTIAVLGCGVDVVYPASNRGLYEKIIEKGGAVISEFPPGQTVLKGLFISRNRIISALAKGVMVVEGTSDSGSLITARYAAEQGKDVFAPPSPITSKMSEAPNNLIKQGAKLVTSVEDIFQEFNIKISPKKEEKIKENLSEFEKQIYDLLKEQSLTLDDLVLKLGRPITEVLKTLSILEVKNLIKKTNNFYQINNSF